MSNNAQVPPGRPLTVFGKIAYEGARNQEAPNINYTVGWWLSWFGNGRYDRELLNWIAQRKRADRDDVIAAAAEVLVQFGDRLREVEDHSPAANEDSSQYNIIPLVTTQVGWSIWRGQQDIPMEDSEWRRVTVSYFQWVCREILKGNLGTRMIDFVLHYMVLPEPTNRRYPALYPPAALRDELAKESFYAWKQFSGGNEPMAIYGRASLEQWRQQHENFSRLDNLLGGTERTLRYASLQEPVQRLQEHLNDFGAKREALHKGLRAYSENKEAAAKVLSPEEINEVEGMFAKAYQAERRLYDTLPRNMWDGDAPSNLAGWIAIAGVGALLAIGLIGATTAATSVLDKLLGRQRAMGLQSRIQRSLDNMAKETEQRRQECRFQAGSIEDPERRAAMLAQCDRDAQRAMAEIAKQQARVAESAVSVQHNVPLSQRRDQEHSAVYLGIGVAAWFALRWVRKRV